MSLLELINHLVEIGIACAKAPGEPVSTTFGDFLAISQHLELAGLSGRNNSVSTKPLFYHGHETRDLGFIVLSCRAGTYLNFHVSSNGMAILSHGMDELRKHGPSIRTLNHVKQWVAKDTSGESELVRA